MTGPTRVEYEAARHRHELRDLDRAGIRLYPVEEDMLEGFTEAGDLALMASHEQNAPDFERLRLVDAKARRMRMIKNERGATP